MEGPSIFLAAQQLSPFENQVIKSISGNTKKICKERLLPQKVLLIFAYKKYLFFQFETFALRVHFLLYGSFEATINNVKVTGDYPKKAQSARLALSFTNGHLEMYNCSLGIVEASNAIGLCDFSTDIMSSNWNTKSAYSKVKKFINSEIADVLLDQEIFGGVGNIIKNEVLFQAKISPLRKIKNIRAAQLKEIIDICRDYVYKFYAWRKVFELKKHYQVYRQSLCPQCKSKITRKRTGERRRISFICEHCQK